MAGYLRSGRLNAGGAGRGSVLGQPNAAFRGDRGEPDPIVRAALAAALGDPAGYPNAVAQLCATRLLLPIAATGDYSGTGPNPDRHAEMAAVMLRAHDGTVAALAFTGLDAMTAWSPAARPIPCTLDQVAQAAIESGAVALIDFAGPAPLVIEHELLREIAAGRRLVRLDDGSFAWLSAANPTAAGGDTAPEM